MKSENFLNAIYTPFGKKYKLLHSAEKRHDKQLKELIEDMRDCYHRSRDATNNCKECRVFEQFVNERRYYVPHLELIISELIEKTDKDELEETIDEVVDRRMRNLFEMRNNILKCVNARNVAFQKHLRTERDLVKYYPARIEPKKFWCDIVGGLTQPKRKRNK